jgi:hypothetical protein
MRNYNWSKAVVCPNGGNPELAWRKCGERAVAPSEIPTGYLQNTNLDVTATPACSIVPISLNITSMRFYKFIRKQTNSVALVSARTIPTERPPPVGEVSSNFCGYRGVTWLAQRIPTAVNLCFLNRSRYFFIQVAPQLTSRGWVDPVPDPLLLRKSGSARGRTRDPCICSQKLWPLDHRIHIITYLCVVFLRSSICL